MKNILLLVHEDAGQEARLQAALDITRAVEGHLYCLDVTVPPMVVPEYYPAAGSIAILAAERERESENGKRIEARLATEQVQWSWTDVTGYPAPALEKAAGLADLIVLNRQLETLTSPDMGSIAAEIIVKSGKPVVAVPEGAMGFDAGGLALIAWDGSAEASTALQAAVPLLRLARAVAILEVEDGSVERPAEEAASYLSRHDIHAAIERRRAGKDAVVTILLAEAEVKGASYIVMGGFGHGRLVEAVFGGVTRRMLAQSPIPLLLAR